MKKRLKETMNKEKHVKREANVKKKKKKHEKKNGSKEREDVRKAGRK